MTFKGLHCNAQSYFEQALYGLIIEMFFKIQITIPDNYCPNICVYLTERIMFSPARCSQWPLPAAEKSRLSFRR